jgi:hypothetical protein
MNSRTSFWMVGITAVVIFMVLMFQLRQPPVPVQTTQTMVRPQRFASELPSELYLLPDSGPPSSRPPKKSKPPAQDPAARAALSLVGKDASAELIWLQAINNSSLPKLERSDLIEDLNEDGFSNRKQPTRADLPLIEARLKLIERLMPEAVDQTNLDAFGEVRKDLINLRAKLGP